MSEETFDSDAAGWAARDNTMSFSHSPGYIQGSFTSPTFPETDAFRVSTGDFDGDYLAAGALSWSFSFTALNVPPSDISVRFGGNSQFFFQPLSPTSGTSTYNVSLSYGSFWFGSGGESEFNSALSSVDFVEIQFTTSGSADQVYRLNSFELSGDPVSGPGGSGAIPEPGSSLFLIGGMILFAMRRWTGIGGSTDKRHA